MVASVVTVDSVVAALARVHERIRSAGGAPDRVKVVAVTKRQPVECAIAAIEAGLDVAEDRVTELNQKAAAIPGGRWHYIGAMQRRNVKKIVPPIVLWQTIDRLAAAELVSRIASGASVMVQVNVTGQPNRLGCNWPDVPDLVETCRAVGLDVTGLMCVGDPEGPRPGFRRLADLASSLDLRELSMGMSGDLEDAVAEGSTLLRLGTTLFGPRSLTG